ncbi:MAG: GSU2403 family nucleotidyltransferase fold protein [Gemmatimonadaceae bacterium]
MTENPGTNRFSRNDADSEAVLSRVLLALGPYREDVILIGGWVPYLYQRFGGFPEWRVEIARTIELDLVVPSPLAITDRPPLAQILEGAGFTSSSANQGSIWVRQDADDEMIEFFTPHQGTGRQLGRPRPIGGQISLAAISLTGLPLLTEQTRDLAIAGGPEGESLAVRVPILGAYLLNKALTFTDRLSAADGGLAKAAKDIVYIRDVIAGGEAVQAQVRSDIELLVKRHKSRSGLVKTARDRVHQLTVGSSRLVDTAVAQIVIQHRFGSDGAARADLVGNMELLANLLDEIAERPSLPPAT